MPVTIEEKNEKFPSWQTFWPRSIRILPSKQENNMKNGVDSSRIPCDLKDLFPHTFMIKAYSIKYTMASQLFKIPS